MNNQLRTVCRHNNQEIIVISSKQYPAVEQVIDKINICNGFISARRSDNRYVTCVEDTNDYNFFFFNASPDTKVLRRTDHGRVILNICLVK